MKNVVQVNENKFLTLNESRAISDETKSAFSPYQRQKPQPVQEPFNSEQEFWDEALRHFSSFFNNPGNPEESLLSVLPPIPTVLPGLSDTMTPTVHSKPDMNKVKLQYPVPTREPPTQQDCQCTCCSQWRHYFSPPRHEVNAKSVPKLCYCVCCRQWDIFLHYTYNTPVFGYYEKEMFLLSGGDQSSSSRTGEKKKRKRKTPTIKSNKENSGKSRKRKEPAIFSNKNLMKKDPTLKLNTVFSPQIPYLTPLDN